MNYGPLIFLAAFFALASSWFGFVLTPQMQLGHMQPTNAVPLGTPYPSARGGLARQGLDVYRANGCAYCHSQQVRQSATLCDVVMTDLGTNQPGLKGVLQNLKVSISDAESRALPKTLLSHVAKDQAEHVINDLKAAGAKVELWVVPVGPDITQAWGKRRSVAEDFLYDSTVMLGSQRIGPDLANVGLRQPDMNWHLRHLYEPSHEVKDSKMPPYGFLFEKRKIQRAPSPEALAVIGSNTEPKYEIVPTEKAVALAAYLVSLRADAAIYSAPFTVPMSITTTDTNAPGTNAPASAAGTNTSTTNAPR